MIKHFFKLIAYTVLLATFWPQNINKPIMSGRPHIFSMNVLCSQWMRDKKKDKSAPCCQIFWKFIFWKKVKILIYIKVHKLWEINHYFLCRNLFFLSDLQLWVIRYNILTNYVNSEQEIEKWNFVYKCFLTIWISILFDPFVHK